MRKHKNPFKITNDHKLSWFSTGTTDNNANNLDKLKVEKYTISNNDRSHIYQPLETVNVKNFNKMNYKKKKEKAKDADKYIYFDGKKLPKDN